MITSINAKEEFNKIQCTLMTKIFNKLRLERNFLNVIKVMFL